MLTFFLFRKLIFSNRADSLVRRISLLSMVGIVISVTSFLVVLFVMNAMNSITKKRIIGFSPHLTIENEKISENVINKIKSYGNSKIFPFETQDVIARTMDGVFKGVIAKGMTESSLDFFFQNLKEINNVSIEINLNELKDNEVIIGGDLARLLGVYEGDYLNLFPPESLLLPPSELPKYQKVKIGKIISTLVTDIDSRVLMYKQGVILTQDFFKSSQIRGTDVYLSNADLSTQLSENLKGELTTLKIETWQERNSALFSALLIEKLAIGSILSLAGLIAGTSIFTVLFLLISQKRVDIAVLKTIGLSSRRSFFLFTNMGFMLSFFAVVIGLILGTGISYYLEIHPLNILPDIYTDSQIEAKIEIPLLIAVSIFSFLLCLVAGAIPAKTAQGVHPAYTLKQ